MFVAVFADGLCLFSVEALNAQKERIAEDARQQRERAQKRLEVTQQNQAELREQKRMEAERKEQLAEERRKWLDEQRKREKDELLKKSMARFVLSVAHRMLIAL